jgi:hypothetical protein
MLHITRFINILGLLLTESCSQIDHILIHKKVAFKYSWCPFRGNECDTDHYLVAAKVRDPINK